MKKWLSFLLALALALTLVGCGGDAVAPDIQGGLGDLSVTTSDTTVANPTESAGDTAPTDTEAADTTATEGVKDTTSTTAQTTTSAVGNTTTKKPTTGKTTTAKTTLKTTTKATTVSSADKQLVDQLFNLSVGASRQNVTLTGVVVSIKEISDAHNNATFTIQVQGTNGTKEIYCYRVTPADGSALQVAVGDTLTLSGTVQNYKGTIEFYPARYVGGSGGNTTKATTTTLGGSSGAIDVNGIYTSKEDVALYLHTYGRLPQNFVTKSQYKALGSPSNKCCGGDTFQNREGLLPKKTGRQYYECDIDTLYKSSRGTKRIVYSNDGLIYYTGDHYASFTLLYGTP